MRALARGDQRAEQTGCSGADDRDVDTLRGGGGASHGAGYGSAIAAPLYFRHAASREHDTGAHPERAARIEALEALLEAQQWLGYEVRKAPRVGESALFAVHPPEHLERVREHCARSIALDPDTPVGPTSLEAALRAAGGACALVEELLAGRTPTGISAQRPPGHHAEPDRAMGFCLFATIAIAARHAVDSLGAQRVLIFDWDVHHGNGTAAVFEHDPAVLFASIHQSPFYPGTGALDDIGSGPGEGYTINLPVPAGSGRADWLGLTEHVVVPAARSFAPDLILISAGFDAHRDDPVGGCALATEDFADLARHVRELARELSVPAGAVLEGGYNVDALAASTAAAMAVLAGEGDRPASIDPSPLVRAAVEAVARRWPAVGEAARG